MPTTLGVHLIFQVTSGKAQLFQFLDGPGGAHRLAETGVDIDQGGQLGHAGDLPAALRHLGKRGQADIRQSELRRQRRTGNVHPVKTLVLDDQRHDRRVRAGKLQQAPRCQLFAERGALPPPRSFG